MLVVGIEGTAWAASAAFYETETETIRIHSDPYVPAEGGIHPREAAEHMSTALPAAIETTLQQVITEGYALSEIDAVAYSQGPGLGPCLRIVGTAARTLAQTLEVPLVGVNHMIAHLEIGRHQSGFDSPVCLNASGANAHLLGYHNGRYRILGETMDTGVGNAIDKFSRHLDWSHPGGPKVESAAKEGEYVELPYVVKGMDFSFSGIMSAAKDAVDTGTPPENVCTGLQETIFAMLTEVAERALSVTGNNELVLGGGVGQNNRLQSMLQAMCDARGASLYVPSAGLLRDNAGMIAVTGAMMAAADQTTPLSDSAVDPGARPDTVRASWRRGDRSDTQFSPTAGAVRGAEATVEIGEETVEKHRITKEYRHPTLDTRLRQERLRAEARLTSAARREGVPTPVIYDIDPVATTLTLERVGECDLVHAIDTDRCRSVGQHLAQIHTAGFVHGDPTVRNVRAASEQTYLIDFGLGYYTEHEEDHAMDLHVFLQSLRGATDDAQALFTACEDGYREIGSEDVLSRRHQIDSRGRYQ